ncbi:hypothetical protein JMJ77_0011124 [Colletotrichum scovillei]|uniref:Uncharacterized protein n=1 Tax=Colletotrichum scovillei TaxID=1209932 RepID=A0A9P7UDF1_9PEZI|nr:hypothetical protein JMJ77_0011124 [Colletotrichum scovillei]KAG7060129.1 hypothetical protein JMJ78_0015408 [Colletotrichum scovillei]KAG7067549.1 hypothetical protein JMJ76_0008981 [Colletotrichum scovillei]
MASNDDTASQGPNTTTTGEPRQADRPGMDRVHPWITVWQSSSSSSSSALGLSRVRLMERAPLSPYPFPTLPCRRTTCEPHELGRCRRIFLMDGWMKGRQRWRSAHTGTLQ